MNGSYIEVLLTPVWNGSEITSMAVRIRTDIPTKQDAPLFSLYKRVTNKTFVDINDTMEIRDENGPLPYRIETETPMHAEMHHYKAKRTPSGMLTITYTADLKQAGSNPCFDLGIEPGGITGSGMTFLPLFAGGPYNLTVDWDLSQMPQGSQGVWTYGSGRATVTGPPSMLTEAFYCAGHVKSVVSDRFAFYWLAYQDYNFTEIAAWNRDTYTVLSRFFQDGNGQYSIFIRRAKDEKQGGTALGRSYMMICPDDQQPVMNKFLFAHEMIHSWVHLADEPFGTCTWYVEGMAEYYSAALLWRNALVSRAELAAEMNKRAEQYYENPHIRITNEEAGTQLFADPDITRIPYGRGMFYLLGIDAAIRKAMQDTQSLDDVLFSMIARYRQNPKTGNREWLEEITFILGNDGKIAFEQMRAGEPIIPADDCFQHALRPYKITGTIRGTQEPCELWQFD